MQIVEFTDRVRGCERRLYRVAHTMLRNEADCEDAVQEALFRAWARIGSLRHEEYFETWLIRILINECRSVYRRRKTAETELNENIVAPAESDGSLMEALMALPDKQRIVIELHCIEGYSVHETAAILKIPEGTVKWRMNAARERLKPVLEKEGLL